MKAAATTEGNRAFILVEEAGIRKFVVTPRTQYWTTEAWLRLNKRLHGLGYRHVYTKRMGLRASNCGKHETLVECVASGVQFVVNGWKE